MPLSKYNSAFGGGSGSAAKAKRAMREHYGPDKGEEMFYKTANSRKRGKHRMTAHKQGESLKPKGA
jgi:hypothetical protein